MSPLQAQLREAMKDAMRAKDKPRLEAIRLALAEIRRVEVDERIECDDSRIIGILDRMVKQRNDSRVQYEKAGRTDLAEQEAFEIDVVRSFLPTPLDEEEVETRIDAAIATTGAAGMRDMGKVMGRLKPELAGRADMGAVSAKVKARLSG